MFSKLVFTCLRIAAICGVRVVVQRCLVASESIESMRSTAAAGGVTIGTLSWALITGAQADAVILLDGSMDRECVCVCSQQQVDRRHRLHGWSVVGVCVCGTGDGYGKRVH